MPRFDVILEALEPLLLGSGQATGNVQTSLPYVAGSVWRGATAGAVLKGQQKYLHSGRPVMTATPEVTFAEVYLGEPAARFGYLYPIREHADRAGSAEALPLPLTAQTCKQHPGFAPHDGHGVVDSLMHRLRQQAGAPPDAAGFSACPQCGQRFERLRGFMRRITNVSTDYMQVKVGTRSFVRVGLNRYTETAQDQVLYVLDALVPGDGSPNGEPPISFLGSWWGSPAQRQQLVRLLDQHLLPEQNGYQLALGAARARGMGRAWLRIVDPQPSNATDRLEQRIDLAQPRQAGQLIDPQHVYATLTLRAPLLLLDTHGLPAQRVTSEILRAYHRTAPSDLHVLHDASVIEREPAGGWSSAWGLPKPLLQVIAAGSVLALRAPAAQRDQLLAYLAELEQGGLGERVAEGWGEVLVCDPFHTAHDTGR